MRLMRQALNGGTAQCVLDTEGPKFPNDWSSDGQFIAYSSQVPDYQTMHTWIVSLSDSDRHRKSRPLLQHSCSELSAYFSPEKRRERRVGSPTPLMKQDATKCMFGTFLPVLISGRFRTGAV
jgi:hypothetical protein